MAPVFLDTTGLEEQEKEKRRQVIEKFQKAPFEEIAAHCESKVNTGDIWFHRPVLPNPGPQGNTCPECSRCFHPPTHLIQMNGHQQASAELANDPFI